MPPPIALSPTTGTLLFWIGAVALAVNIPLGYIRGGQRKYSLGWFVCIHLSVPLIAWLRIENQVDLVAVPLFVGCALAGQLAGGRVRRTLGR